MQQFKKDELLIRAYPTRAEMGAAAAAEVSAKIRALLAEKPFLRMVFAAAPSQEDFLQVLRADDSIDFSRIVAFHLDEYVGLAKDAPPGFGNFLRARLFDRVTFRQVHFMDGLAPDIAAECRRYGALLNEAPPDIACIGIGENAHLAFNDPPVADFADRDAVKVVELDQVCRVQQVHDGCFTRLEQVPTHALTMTIPAILAAAHIYSIVPAKTKANAVYHSLNDPISTAWPASVLRRCPGAVLYLDADSAARLPEVGNLAAE